MVLEGWLGVKMLASGMVFSKRGRNTGFIESVGKIKVVVLCNVVNI